MKLNVPQCVTLIKNLDAVGYLPLSEWKKLDEVVVAIKTSETYNWLWEDVKAKAEEIMKELKEKNEPLEAEANDLYKELDKLWDKEAKKERKKIRQRLGELGNEWDKNLKFAQQSLLDYQDHKMDLDAREIYIVDVEDDFYQVLDAKFHIDDKKFDPDDKTSWFVERLDTDNLKWEIEIPVDTVSENKISDEENAG